MTEHGSWLKSLRDGVRTAWGIMGVTLLLFAALEATCRIAVLIHESRTIAGGLPIGDVYDGAEWIDDYAREFDESQRTAWRDWVYWRRLPYQGEWINIDDQGLRSTWNAPPVGEQRPMRIFLFGGSTMWGSGARDDYTIASCVARQLTERGFNVEVTNFAESGYVSNQELLTLMGELKKGNIPDLVVFYDGVNDTYSTYQNGQAGLTQNEPNRRAEFNILRRPAALAGYFAQWGCRGSLKVANTILRRSTGTPQPAAGEGVPQSGPLRAVDDPATAARETIEQYQFIVKTVKGLAKDYGFDALFYWQPTLFEKPQRSAFEEKAAVRSAAKEAFFRTVYDAIGRDEALRADPHFHDLSQIFAAETKPLFVDFCHIGEPGNERIAQAIVDDICKRREGCL